MPMIRARRRRAFVSVGAALACAILPCGGWAKDWADETADYASGPEFARSKAVCRLVRHMRPAAADLPTPAQAAALKGCNAEALYYGEHGGPDFARARLCALLESDGGEGPADRVFAGPAILMMLYANGLGVPRNLDLAAHYACNLDAAPTESDGRVKHLMELKAKGPEKGRFDYCSDASSGLAQGYCAGLDQTRADIRRQGELDGIARGLPPAAQEPLAALRRAAYAYATAHARHEVDLSGTARAADSIREEEETRDGFLKDLRLVVAGRLPLATAAAARDIDGALNASFHDLRTQGEKLQAEGTVTFSGVQAAQRAWLRYREAFLAFARAAAPTRPVEGLLVRLTRERIDVLDDIVG